MVSKRSDFFVSHVGRAQLALMKRCYPGGYPGVVARLRADCGLPPLTKRAARGTILHQRKAGQLLSGATVWTSEEVKAASTKKLKGKSQRSTTQTIEGKLLKAANEARCAAHNTHRDQAGKSAVEGGTLAEDSSGKTGKKRKRGGAAPSGLSTYDRGSSSSSRNLDESMVNPAKKARAKGMCRACVAFGVSGPWLLGKGHARASARKCPQVQQQWSEAGKPEAHPHTPNSPTASQATVRTPTAAPSKAAATPAKAPARKPTIGVGKIRTKANAMQLKRKTVVAEAAATPSRPTSRSSGRTRHRPARFVDAAEEGSDDDGGGEELHESDSGESGKASEANYASDSSDPADGGD
ncbi:unnamed protein product [Pylaiella littoralis]